MNREEKIKQVEVQISEMAVHLADSARSKIRGAISAAPDSFMCDDYLLAKAIMDSVCVDRPFSALHDDHKKIFRNIHLCS